MHEAAVERLTAPFTMTPYTENCARLSERAEHVLVGVSPGNGYFNQERLTALLRWASATFGQVDAIVPDASLVHTYQALGQSPETAWTNARHKVGKTYRRVARAWAEIGVPPGEQRIHLLSDFVDHPVYTHLRDETDRAVERDPALREAFLQTSRRVLSAFLKDEEPTDEQVEEGKNYLTAEMPLCLDTPALLGVSSSVAVYHHRLPMAEVMFSSPYLNVSPLQGHAVVRPSEGGR
ncbi:tRNA-dependent cyclodipeptide synthase [Actinomadura oligospora]|uniref:tRNA-dependent cyclodipeptide synthase n=1 Tax=Actinomadura oligospora TaxID=111804 RepID=UPI0004B12CFE|nr:tRNA-dependent cyclodipeptide synthase [Actinomadura oligospora]